MLSAFEKYMGVSRSSVRCGMENDRLAVEVIDEQKARTFFHCLFRLEFLRFFFGFTAFAFLYQLLAGEFEFENLVEQLVI